MTNDERQTVIQALELAQHAAAYYTNTYGEYGLISGALAIMLRDRGPSPEMLKLRADCAAETLALPRG